MKTFEKEKGVEAGQFKLKKIVSLINSKILFRKIKKCVRRSN